MNKPGQISSPQLPQTLLWIALLFALLSCAAFLLPKLFVSNNDEPQLPSYKLGCIDNTGKVVVPPIFESIVPFRSKVTNVTYKGLARFINRDGVFITPEAFQLAKPFSQGLAAIWRDGKWGFIDEYGKMAIPPRFDDAEPFSGGLARVSFEGTFAFVDKKGQLTRLSKDFVSVDSLKNGLAKARSVPAWLFIDSKGERHLRSNILEVFPHPDAPPRKLLAAKALLNPSASAGTSSEMARWGLVNDRGEFVVKPFYTEIPSVSKDRILLVDQNSAVLTDLAGRQIARFESAFPVIYPNVVIIKEKGKWGLADHGGKFIVNPRFEEIRRLSDGDFAGRNGKTWTLMNSAAAVPADVGQKVSQLVSATVIKETHPINSMDKWGAADASGKVIIPCLYDRPVTFGKDGSSLNYRNEQPYLLFCNGKQALVSEIRMEGGGVVLKQISQVGFINKRGEWVIPPNFDECGEFANGVLSVRQGAKWGTINAKGGFVCAPKYDFIGSYSNDGLAPFKLGSHWGFLDATGRIVIDPSYDEVHGFSEGMAAVQLKKSGWGYVDKTGARIVPLGYFGATDFSDSRSLVWKIKTQNTLASPFVFFVIDKAGSTLAGPFGYALPSGRGMFSVSDDFLNWKLLDQQFHTVCVFKHFRPGFNFNETLPMVNDRMVVLLPADAR